MPTLTQLAHQYLAYEPTDISAFQGKSAYGNQTTQAKGFRTSNRKAEPLCASVVSATVHETGPE